MDSKAALTRLEYGISTLATSQGWRDWLAFQGKFHRYSYGNVLLILGQKPGATHVAGYHAWAKLGRYPSKGSGISILAPMAYRKAGEDESEPARHMFFRVVTVFDVSDTTGDALPEMPIAQVQGGDEALYSKLCDVALQLGYTVTEQAWDDQNLGGYVEYAAHSIVIRQQNALAHKCKTVLHEMGHALLHDGNQGLAKGLVELEAESVAYVASDALGMDTSAYSFAYCLNWAGSDNDVKKALKASANRIAGAVKRIMAIIDPEQVDTADGSALAA
jgi:hypothetical protein